MAAGARLGAVLGLTLGAVAFWLFGWDRTAGMQPAEIVRAAAQRELSASAYRFAVELSGRADVASFPAMALHGTFRRRPATLHLEGDAVAGERHYALEYYAQGDLVYSRRSAAGAWALEPPGTATSLQPDRAAQALQEGLRSATLVGRERVAGRRTVRLQVQLDPRAVQELLGDGMPGAAAYTLWVDLHTLRPVRLAVAYRSSGVAFLYQLTWDYGWVRPFALPPAVRQAGQTATSGGP